MCLYVHAILFWVDGDHDCQQALFAKSKPSDVTNPEPVMSSYTQGKCQTILKKNANIILIINTSISTYFTYQAIF